MSDEKENENKPEEEVVEAASTEAAAEEAAAEEVAAAPEEAAAAPVEKEEPAVEAKEEAAPAKEEPAAEAKEEAAPAKEEPAAEAKEEAAPAKEEPAAEAKEEAKPAEGEVAPEKAKFDKLEKAEEILKASAPVGSSRPSRPGGFGRGPREVEDDGSFEKVVFINRCAKVVKGGRRFSFSALVVTGDKEGKVGYGFGKAKEVAECIKKASESSKKSMVAVKVTNNTIPHPVIGEHGGGRVLLRPASPGTGLIAGGGVRAVVEAAGIKDVLAKSMGSNNHANVVKATLNALEQLRTKEEIYTLRGKRLPEKKAL